MNRKSYRFRLLPPNGKFVLPLDDEERLDAYFEWRNTSRYGNYSLIYSRIDGRQTSEAEFAQQYPEVKAPQDEYTAAIQDIRRRYPWFPSIREHFHVCYLSEHEKSPRQQRSLSAPMLTEHDCQRFIEDPPITWPSDVDWLRGRPMPVVCRNPRCLADLASKMHRKRERVFGIVGSSIVIGLLFLLTMFLANSPR